MKKTNSLSSNLPFILVATACLSPARTASAIVVTQNTDSTSLANAVINANSGLTVTGSSLVFHNNPSGAASSGTYTNASSTYGIGPGVILSTGNVSNYADGQNASPTTGTLYNIAATVNQEALLDPITGNFNHFDVTQFDLTFNVDASTNSIFFNVVFGSEEFDAFVGLSFIDGFGLYLNGANIAFVNALPVNINHPQMAFTPGTELNGVLSGSTGALGTNVHTFTAPITPGSTANKLTFILGDTDDKSLDTTVYISQLGGTPPIPEPTTFLIFFPLGLTLLLARRTTRTAASHYP